MIPVGTDVCTMVRENMGDTEVSGGQVWTNTRLLPYLSLANQKLVGELQSVESDLLNRDQYAVLPAYYSLITPAVLGLSSLEELSAIRVRVPTSYQTVTGVTDGSGYVDLTVSSTTGFVTGTYVQVSGVNGVDGEWVVTVVNGTTLRLIGANYVSGWTSGGTVCYATADWSSDLTKTRDTKDFSRTIGSFPSRWCQQQDGWKIEASSQALQLKCQITASGAAITSASESLLIDGSLSFFVSWITAYIAGPKGRRDLTQQHQDIWLSELNRLKSEAVKDSAMGERVRVQAYRSSQRFRY